MSGYVIEAIQDNSSVRDTTGQVVFMAIGRCCNHDGVAGAGGRHTAPSIDYIAGVAKVHRNTVLNWIPQLEETGELKVERHGKGRGAWNRYIVNLPIEIPAEKDEEPEENDDLREIKEAILMVQEMVQGIAEAQQETVQEKVHNGLPQDGLDTRDTQKRKDNTPPNPPQGDGDSGRDVSNSEYREVVRVYEQEIGPISRRVAERIAISLTEFSSHLVVEAIHLAAENNVRKWRYVEGIFDRWRTEGRAGGPDKRWSPQDLEGTTITSNGELFVIKDGKPQRIENDGP